MSRIPVICYSYSQICELSLVFILTVITGLTPCCAASFVLLPELLVYLYPPVSL